MLLLNKGQYRELMSNCVRMTDFVPALLKGHGHHVKNSYPMYKVGMVLER